MAKMYSPAEIIEDDIPPWNRTLSSVQVFSSVFGLQVKYGKLRSDVVHSCYQAIMLFNLATVTSCAR